MKGPPSASGSAALTPVPNRARRSSTGDAPGLGLRRIDWVKIELRADGHRGAVVGVSHRLPVERSLPLGTALALWRSGVPTVIRRRGSRNCAVSSELAGGG